MELIRLLLPEIVLTTGALILFVSAFVRTAAARHFAAFFALGTTLTALVVAVLQVPGMPLGGTLGLTELSADGAVRLNGFAAFVRPMVLFVGALLLLLSWPGDEEATGNNSADWGQDAGEYFALLLLSLCGAVLTVSSNDLMLLFLGIELAAIPTYVLVSMEPADQPGAGGGREVLLPRRGRGRADADGLHVPLRQLRDDRHVRDRHPAGPGRPSA